MASQYYEGIGRRKEASARVRIFPGGTGRLTINDRDGGEFLAREGDYEIAIQPLTVIGQERAYDISVHVNGGGVTGQRDAIRLGLARALLELDPDLR
ncbi:MAG: 30S ribosomal protein S9, partial [Chloroflexota bacterium]